MTKDNTAPEMPWQICWRFPDNDHGSFELREYPDMPHHISNDVGRFVPESEALQILADRERLKRAIEAAQHLIDYQDTHKFLKANIALALLREVLK